MLDNTVRIIAGKWRGKKLSFPTGSTLRPTLDQIRETLFNWLQPTIADARCLDAFTGSGALGIEALSRGAAHTTFIDSDAKTLAHLRNNLQTFEADNYDSIRLTLPAGITQIESAAYDIIFLDPPFNTDLLENTLEALSASTLVKPGTFVYFETTKHRDFSPEAPWEIYRYKKTKRLAYGLLRFHKN